MAGISVPQYEIFKIGTNKLKYSNWDLEITKKEAFKYQELISLFEAQEFRIMANKILQKPISNIDFSKIKSTNRSTFQGSGGSAEPPCPGRSGAITRWLADR